MLSQQPEYRFLQMEGVTSGIWVHRLYGQPCPLADANMGRKTVRTSRESREKVAELMFVRKQFPNENAKKNRNNQTDKTKASY